MITQHCFDIYSNLHSNVKVGTESTESRPTPRPTRSGRRVAADSAADVEGDYERLACITYLLV